MCKCPSCEWYPPEDDFYYCRDGKAIKCTRFSMESPKVEAIEIIEGILQSINLPQDREPQLKVYGKPPFKHLKSYPRIENYSSSTYASYEFGLDGHDWLETHKCPVCKKEYCFENSDF